MPAAVAPAEARRLWTFIEPIHDVTYFCPQPRAAFEAANLRGFWRGYFAGRSAPLGPVGAAPVIALFYVFAPHMVARALPDVWSRAAPEVVLRARVEGSAAALADALPAEAANSGSVKAAADLLAEVAAAVDIGGRALAAANAALPVPDGDDLARLWHLCTVLREHRGDGHMASLLTAGVDGCAALRWRQGHDDGAGDLQSTRGWSDEDWTAAGERLVARGWLDADGAVTPLGRQEHDALEEQTDRLAAPPWAVLGERHRERLVELLTPIRDAVVAVLPYPNPVGLPRPSA